MKKNSTKRQYTINDKQNNKDIEFADNFKSLLNNPVIERDSEPAVAQWLRASIFRQICMSTFEWRGFESRWCLSVGI